MVNNSSMVNDGLINAQVEGRTAYAFSSYVTTSETDASTFTNNGTFTFDVTSTAVSTGIAATAVRIGTRDSFINNGTLSGTVTATGSGAKGIELYKSDSIFPTKLAEQSTSRSIPPYSIRMVREPMLKAS